MNTKIAVLFAVLLAVVSAHAADSGAKTPDGPRLKIVATSFPHYDWTRQVLGARAAQSDLVLLQRGGIDLHSYAPSAADLVKIAACDIFVYVGGESDAWVARALAQPGNPRRRVLRLMAVLGGSVKREEPVEGMEEHGEEEGEDELDEHVWLSLRNARRLVASIAAELAAADPGHADEYRANAERYSAELAGLDAGYAAAVAAAPRRTVLFADRYPFRYMADDYGLKCYAAFAGCSAESEASFRTVAFLAKKVDELKLPAILVLEGATHRIADTVRAQTATKDQKVLPMDSMQSVTARDAGSTTYFGVMRRNLETLKEALK